MIIWSFVLLLVLLMACTNTTTPCPTLDM